MDALLMCGGRGTRLETEREKPLVPIDGTPMVDRVRAALEASAVETIHAVVSPSAPATRDHLADLDRIETPGEGYVADLGVALEAVDPPVLTVAADLPLLSGAAIDRVLAVHEGGSEDSTTVCVPVALKRRLGASVDATLESRPHLAPTGVNVVGVDEDGGGENGGSDGNRTMARVSYDPRLAVNVNRVPDAELAERLLADGNSGVIEPSEAEDGS